ncbi:hypothetical protein [Streptomyces sp. UNOC14_S4]|uniref:hypothetical protein n=1 Tax=Streptomyces sp. UNOC14_S4 TaxID=2872340 RepID=UPI001E4FC86D|nr:hypothetical protein [Streptomyces sp. UNOC14_S4]MCC3767722.1 hypothetical protein [Streptomyces sp. UNOC14_S4]
MRAVDPGPLAVGIAVLTVSALGFLLLLLWWLSPVPRHAFTPPPADAPGHRFRCYCHAEPITVIVLDDAEHEQRLVARARHRRRHARRASRRRLWRLIRNDAGVLPHRWPRRHPVR